MIFRKGKWKGLGPLSAGFVLTFETSDDVEWPAVLGVHLRTVFEQIEPASVKEPGGSARLAEWCAVPDHDFDLAQLAGPGRARLRGFVLGLLHEVWSLQDNIGARDAALFVQMVAVETVGFLGCEDEWEVVSGA